MILVRYKNVHLPRTIFSHKFYSTKRFLSFTASFETTYNGFIHHRPFSTRQTTRRNKDKLISKNEDSPITFEHSDTIKCTKDQWIYKPTAREIKLFLESKIIPTRPIDLEHSVVVRLVDLDKSVTSPVGSTMLFSEYGIRKNERIKLFVIWAIFTASCIYLGVWQLKRKKWKEELLDNRQKSLSKQKTVLNSLSDLKTMLNNENNGSDENLIYRVFEAKGVLDTKQQFLVGPRRPLTQEYGKQVGYYVLYPFRFSDGSSILLNMGWLNSDDVFEMNVSPEWVTVRGVLTPGEISEHVIPSLKHKFLKRIEKMVYTITKREIDITSRINRPSQLMRNDDRTVYRYMDAETIATNLFSTEPSLTQKYILNAYDSYFDEDKPDLKPTKDTLVNRLIRISAIRPLAATEPARSGPNRYNFQRRQKSDYLLFYADPGTHFNYAMQWFLIALSITCLSVYKAFRIKRVLRHLNV